MAKSPRQLWYSVTCNELDLPLVRMVGWTDLRATVPLTRHRNDGYEITCVLRGEVAWEIAGSPPMKLTGGQLSLMQPRVEHRGEMDVIRPSKLFWIILNPTRRDAGRNALFTRKELSYLDARLAAAGNCVGAASEQLLDRIGRLCEPVRRLAEKGDDPLLRAAAAAIASQVIVEIVRSLEAAGPRPLSPPIHRAMEYLHEHLAQPLDIELLAGLAGTGRTRFYELFGRQTGQSPADYLARLRCQQATTLLRSSGISVTEIALRCGFSSSQYFARAFRRYCGRTPSEIRRGRGALTSR